MSGKPEGSKEKSRPPISFLGSRIKAMGTTQWEAYTVGFTLLGGVLLGAGTGWWLDQKFGTSFFLPVLFLVGVAGGFREMLLTIQRVTREAEKRHRPAPDRDVDSRQPNQEPEVGAAAETPNSQIPAPPLPSWEVRKGTQRDQERDGE